MTDTPILYRPGSGSEGAQFAYSWCDRCTADQAHRETDGMADGCEILARTFALEIHHPNYPKEWRRDGPSGPRCTAFTASDEANQPLDPSAVVRPLL